MRAMGTAGPGTRVGCGASLQRECSFLALDHLDEYQQVFFLSVRQHVTLCTDLRMKSPARPRTCSCGTEQLLTSTPKICPPRAMWVALPSCMPQRTRNRGQRSSWLAVLRRQVKICIVVFLMLYAHHTVVTERKPWDTQYSLSRVSRRARACARVS